MINVLFCGPGRSGKDVACEALCELTPHFKNAGTTSKYLVIEMAKRLGLSTEEAYARRHESDEMRTLWYNTGNEIRDGDPLYLVRQAFTNGNVSGGIRAEEEARGCFDDPSIFIVWVDRPGVKVDPTLKFGKEYAHYIITNNGTEEEFREKVKGLGRALIFNLSLGNLGKPD